MNGLELTLKYIHSLQALWKQRPLAELKLFGTESYKLLES